MDPGLKLPELFTQFGQNWSIGSLLALYGSSSTTSWFPDNFFLLVVWSPCSSIKNNIIEG